jgi:outer membrane protein assembly factor BamE
VIKLHTFALHLRTGLALALLVVAAAGCSSNRWGFPYKVSVQQGNWITKDQVSLLRTGMTREQVRFALGTPMLASALHSNRWDYPYFYRAGSGKIEERTLTIFFNGAQLESWRGEEQPELQPFQIARDDVGVTVREDKQIKLDNERLNNDGEAAVQLIPGVNIDQMQSVNGAPLSDPQALPGAPEDAPIQLR